MVNARVIQMVLLLGTLFVAGCTPLIAPDPSGEGPTLTVTPEETVETPEATVAILVVDKFTTSIDTEAANAVESGRAYPLGEGCIIDPSGSGYRSGGGGGAEHGRLVWSTITATLAESHDAVLESGQPDAELWEFIASPLNVANAQAALDFDAISQSWRLPGHGHIRMIPVDIGDFDTATVADKLTETLNTLDLYDEGISLVVLNLSWVILPKGDCEQPTDADEYGDLVCTLADADDATREEFLEEVKDTLDDLNLPAGSFEDVCADSERSVVFSNGAVRVATYPFLLRRQFAELEPEAYLGVGSEESNDALGELSRRCAAGDDCAQHTITIGAAGNRGWEFPMMPALWNSVVSVSAQEGLNFDAAACDANGLFCSNSAEVAMMGTHPYEDELVAGTTPDCVPGFDCALYEDEVKGSSYAAPRLSLLAALYLLGGGANPCMDRPDIHPPLGYITEVNDATDPGAWQNLDVATAASLFCNAFPQ